MPGCPLHGASDPVNCGSVTEASASGSRAVTREEEIKQSRKKNRLARSAGWLAWALIALSLPVLSLGITLWFTGPAWFYYRETDIVRKISIALLIVGPAILLTGLMALLLSRLLWPKRTRQLNLNTAILEELQALPGIGIIRATAIVEYRQQKGPFLAMADLVQVPGVGWTTLEGLRDMVTLE